MAYDPNSAYEPPRRAYYGQPQAQAPIQNGYGSQHQGYYDEYSQQEWNGGYDQQYDQRYELDTRQARGPQSPQYQDQYNSQYQSAQHQTSRQPNGYAEHPPGQERQYDARYQQRPERGRQQQQQYDQPLPRQQKTQQSRQDGQYLMEKPRPNPKTARVYNQEGQSQRSAYTQQPAQGSASGRPQTAPHQQQKRQDASKMDEWKAKERARMHEDAMSPEVLAWDNAFPTFPTKREQSRPRTANGEHVEHGSPESGRDQRGEGRPSMSRGHSHNDPTSTQAELQGESYAMNHQAHYDDGYQQISATQLSPQYNDRFPYQATSPTREVPPQQQPMSARRISPPNGQFDSRQPPPQNQAGMYQYSQSDRRTEQQPQQAIPRGRFVQPINTAQATPRAPYMDHQPLSPANVPQRPSTAQGSRGNTLMTSPTSAYPAQSPQELYGSPIEQYSNSYSQNGPQLQQTTSGVYGGNTGNSLHAPAPVQSRAAEIEAEMPDFDSAAPGGTSLLHKRTQNDAKPYIEQSSSAPPQVVRMPPQQSNSSSSLPTSNQVFYDQQQNPNARSHSDQRVPKQKQGGITDGFVFGVPGESAQSQQYSDYQQQGQHSMPYAQPEPPVQPPYARQDMPRRSMDDARQMPYRQGPPPQQRMHSNRGAPPRGQQPLQQRSGMDRSVPAQQRPQPPYADPMQQRGGSAPPMRPGHQMPPGQGPPGAPLQQQRPHPESQKIQRGNSNPDSLPQHPTPVRPGHMANGSSQNSKPPPVRNYPDAPNHSHQRSLSLDQSSKPITRQDLDRLRASVDANPGNSKQGLLLVKKLVEASIVLAPEGGRADPRTAAKNREMYMTDAHKRLKRLVAAGYAEAQFYMADCYGQGTLGLEVDPTQAFNLYQAAAKAGHAEAAYRTAMCCEMGAEEGGGTRRDYPKAVQWYRRAAALGDSSGMFKIGVILLKGLLGQPKNVGEGVSWLKRVAERGDCDNPQALFELAGLYESTNTNPEVRNKVVSDDRYALELFDKAAHLGHKYAQLRLGQAYEYGNLGLTIDNRQSIGWYSKAAAQGEHQAELALSGWYLTGAEGILEHSDMEAYLWARKAATSEPPLAKAMFAMGYFTETGIGCPASFDEAKKWYGRAATHNFPKARERLEELRKNGAKGSRPVNGKLTRKDQKRDEAECVVM